MWEVTDFKKEYFQEMLEMTMEHYGIQNDISDSGFIEHEYFANPAGDAFIKLAYDKEKQRLAGQYIVIPRVFCVNGSLVACVLSLNTLTRADYRGQRVFTRLAEAVYTECREQKRYFCYGAPNQNSFHGFMNKLAFSDMGNMPLYLKIINPYRLLCDKLHISYKYHTGKKQGKRKIAKHGRTDIRIAEVTDKNVRLFDVFWKMIRKKYPVIGMRDSEYIKWRYIDMPLRDYSIYMAVQNGRPCGYIIGRVSEVADMRCGMIVDFLVKEGRKDVGRLLLEKVIFEFQKQRIGLLGCLMQKGSEEALYLQKKRFFICPQRLLPQPFPIIFRQFRHLSGKKEAALQNFSHWFFTMGDYDVI